MSTVDERRSALQKARALLEELATTNDGVGVPENVRSHAQEILRHLPRPQDVVDVLTVVQEYANSLEQAEFGQAFAPRMSERARSDAQRAEDMKSWLVIGTSLSVAVAFAVSAFFAATEGGGVTKVIWLSLGAVVSGSFGALIAVDWLREGRRGTESDAERDLERVQLPASRRLTRRLGREVPAERDFGKFSEPSSKGGDEHDRE
jgi:hypothetical protein